MCGHPGILQLLASGARCPSVGGNTRLTGGSSGHAVFVYVCVVGVFKNVLGIDIDFLGLSVPIYLLPGAMGGAAWPAACISLALLVGERHS